MQIQLEKMLMVSTAKHLAMWLTVCTEKPGGMPVMVSLVLLLVIMHGLVFFSGSVYATGSYSSSDERFKSNIEPLNSSTMLSKIMQLQPRKYQFLTNEVLTEQNLPTLNAKEGEHYGLIAQDLEQIFPELVVDVIHQLQNDEKASSETVTTKAINYQELTVVLLAVVQNLQAELEALKTKK